MSLFKAALTAELLQSQSNNFGLDNFDEHRFGRLYPNAFSAIINQLKIPVKKITGFNNRPETKKRYTDNVNTQLDGLEKYMARLENLYQSVNSESKKLIVKLMAYRIAGFTKVKLPVNNKEYWKGLERAKALKINGDTYNPHFIHLILNKFDLKEIGYDISLYFNELGIAIDFIIEQYAYKLNGKKIVGVDAGDVVFDVGGCWGDTALYFASKAGKDGQVFSFEFVPNNIELFNINTNLNPELQSRIELIRYPVSNTSHNQIYFKDAGPSSRIESQPFEGQTGSTTTLTIDDFVAGHGLTKVDFIKMDIEGAESFALKGALETIRKFRPKLAIATYHSLDDFVNIPQWIIDLGLGYELFLGHYTIHSEETVCFAKVKGK